MIKISDVQHLVGNCVKKSSIEDLRESVDDFNSTVLSLQLDRRVFENKPKT